MRDLAARRDVGKVEMNVEARALFEKLRSHIFTLDSDVLELAEPKSVSYHSPAFFLEVLPRRYSLTLLLALDFNEVDDPSGLAQDATQREFFIHARHEGGVALSVSDERSIESAVPLIRQAHAAACG
jgi:predicted transport protein